ncbi:MAG: type VI secretion system baseplate subunit TssE [Pseudomonadota bacterium]
MAFEKSLLERIRAGDPSAHRRVTLEPADVAESVIRHLAKMFNVRQGSALTSPDYGMPDFNDLALQFPNAINVIRRVIRESVDKYEPRLKNVAVAHMPNEDNPLELRFKITAQLVLDGDKTPVAFETVMDDAGKVRVR